jgi:hypothetical protein
MHAHKIDTLPGEARGGKVVESFVPAVNGMLQAGNTRIALLLRYRPALSTKKDTPVNERICFLGLLRSIAKGRASSRAPKRRASLPVMEKIEAVRL